MRVSRAQADANHQNVIDVASRLFREHGFDGIGLKDVMKAAGLTQGGFYKQFESKEDLAVRATARAVHGSIERWVGFSDSGSPLEALLAFYLSTAHRDGQGRGCPLVALGSDAARKSPAVRSALEDGIRSQLGHLDLFLGNPQGEAPSAAAMATLSMMVGALALSRMVNDDALSKDFLTAATDGIGTIAADLTDTDHVAQQ